MLGPQSAEQLTDGWILVIYSFCTVHFQHLFPCRWFSTFIFCALGIFIIFLPRTLLLTRPTEDYSWKLYVQLQRFSFGETRMIAEYLSKTLTNFLVDFKYTFGSNCRIPCHFKAVSLKELLTLICSYPFYALFYLQWLSERQRVILYIFYAVLSVYQSGYVDTQWLLFKRYFLSGYMDTWICSDKVDTWIRSEWVSAYARIHLFLGVALKWQGI